MPEDSWVTVYGFAAEDLPALLGEFQKCGDVLQWGSFGAPPGANFVHIQYQNQYGAQRALLKGGEQLTPRLIVGVKPLDARHRAQIEAYAGSGPGALGLADVAGTPAIAAQPYRLEAGGAQPLPTPSRTLMQKFSEFVLGV